MTPCRHSCKQFNCKASVFGVFFLSFKEDCFQLVAWVKDSNDTLYGEYSRWIAMNGWSEPVFERHGVQCRFLRRSEVANDSDAKIPPLDFWRSIALSSKMVFLCAVSQRCTILEWRHRQIVSDTQWHSRAHLLV
jgi:hypothetical protein